MNPGPDTEIDGVRYPVFFLRDKFEKFVGSAFGSAKSPPVDSGAPLRRRGRQKGQGSFEVVDLPILNEMKDLISARKAASPEEAARVLVLAGKAYGAATIESEVRVLRSGIENVDPETVTLFARPKSAKIGTNRATFA